MHKETKQLAALKQVALEEEEDLETFMIEIDILSEFKHKNVVELLEAYHYDGKLWVCCLKLNVICLCVCVIVKHCRVLFLPA